MQAQLNLSASQSALLMGNLNGKSEKVWTVGLDIPALTPEVFADMLLSVKRETSSKPDEVKLTDNEQFIVDGLKDAQRALEASQYANKWRSDNTQARKTSKAAAAILADDVNFADARKDLIKAAIGSNDPVEDLWQPIAEAFGWADPFEHYQERVAKGLDALAKLLSNDGGLKGQEFPVDEMATVALKVALTKFASEVRDGSLAAE